MLSLIKKSFLFAILFSLTISTGLHAQPRATVSEPVKDLGSFYTDQPLVYDFLVKNEGNASLQITDVKPACGCTATEYDKTIEPGQTGKVHAKVDISRFSGPIAKSITVMTNDAANPQIELIIKANVKQVIAATPGFARFNILQGESENSKDVQVLASGDGTQFDVLGVTSSTEGVSASFREATATERLPDLAGKQWAVDIALNAEKIKIGPLSDYVTVTTNNPRQNEIKIPITGVVRPVMRIDHADLNFGEVGSNDGDHLTRNIVVRGNSLTKSFTVTRAETDVKGITVQVKPTFSKNEFELTVTVDPAVVKGDFNGKVVFYTDNKMKPMVEVPMKGTVL